MIWKWKEKFVKKDDCEKFAKDNLKNPVTNRKIKEGGPVQKWFKKTCEGEKKPPKGSSNNNLSEFVKSQGSIGLVDLIKKITEHQGGRFTKDLKIAFTRGFKGAIENELQEVILDLGARKFRISTTGPISKRLQRLEVPGGGFREEEIEGADVSQKNFCATKNIKALPKRRKFEAQPHQTKAVEFMASRPDSRLLLEHGLGSGKTCTSAMVIDDYLRKNPDNMIYFFSPGNLRSNFIAEYCSFCPVDKRIDPENKDYKNFRFFSLDDGTLKRKLPKRFEDCLVVVDEAQSLISCVKSGDFPPSSEDIENAEGVKNLVVLYKKLTDGYSNMKLLMLSGTPMPDTLDQYYNCIKLLKPEEMEYVSYEEFENMFEVSTFNNQYYPRSDDFESLFSDCISYYKSAPGDVARVLTSYEDIELDQEDPISQIIEGAIESENKIRRIPLESLINSNIKRGMSFSKASQLAVFLKARAARRSRSCGLSNVIYPSQLSSFNENEEDRDDSRDYDQKEDDEILKDFEDNLELFFDTFAPKLGRLVENLENEEHCPGKQIIYCPFKVRHGVNLISKILRIRGISNVVYSGDVSQTKRETILREYNDVSNDNGERTKVFIFTDAAAEGISLLSIRGVHLINEDIYASHMRQVIGRAVRYLSHSRLPEEDREVTVFRYRLDLGGGYSADSLNESDGIARENKIKNLEQIIHTKLSI